ncbi:MAG TPA: hypothetical protein DCZ94_14010 [Lentisphaeria bacterium]|nr:MAG: hypothetical protein A2X48_03830 [Lentisphaerae bacterium GWF2_49_21]HBC88060.1 hypothetical protein [Lentisphaeria bacterium]
MGCPELPIKYYFRKNTYTGFSNEARKHAKADFYGARILANSNLISGITYPNGIPVMKSYEANI